MRCRDRRRISIQHSNGAGDGERIALFFLSSRKVSMIRISRMASPAAVALVAIGLNPVVAGTAFAAAPRAGIPAAAASAVIEVPGAALGVQDVGPLAASALVPVDFVLNDQRTGELDRDVALISTPGSPYYRHFLSNAQWNTYFAPTAQSVQRVGALLVRAGFTVTSVAPNNAIVTAVAPAATVQKFFSTTLRAVIQPGLGLRYRNATPAVIPAELSTDVMTVVGLDTLETIHLKRLPPGVPETPAQAQARLAAKSPPLFGPAGVRELGPQILVDGYHYPTEKEGAGVTVGISVPDTAIVSDTATYLKYFEITQTGKLTIVPVDGGYKGGPQLEGTLDVETISGLAPAADILFYQWPNFENKSIIDALNAIVSDHKVSSVSNSWAGSENEEGSSLLKSSDAIFKQAVVKGIEFIFSSGDAGAEADHEHVVAEWPACDPNVTSLGGVHIHVDATTGAINWTTATWKNLGSDKNYADGSGGGVSHVYSLPSYQSKAAYKTTGRNVPDISVVGDEEDANYAAVDGGWYAQGGTSWSGPAFNAMLADVESVTGKTTGFINPTLYAAYGTDGASFVTDVLEGANGIDGLFGYPAVKGFDLATGMGTPVGIRLLPILK
jgi:kumamolisin